MDAADGVEPLFLQAKEAQPSVLADYAGRSQYNNQGERVVAGQHLQQAQSDIFLGWTRAPNPLDGVDHDFYVRQLNLLGPGPGRPLRLDRAQRRQERQPAAPAQTGA